MKLDTVSPAAAESKATPATRLPGTSGATAAGSPPSAPVHPVAQAQPPASAEAAKQAAARINEFLRSNAANVEFAVDATSDHVIVRVVDSETHQLIRQMPTEETLAISRALDRLTGLLLAQKA
ncbi:MAG: flagellar protein FlaG [Burkholderiales bacterium]|nr:flagellar protein FlaG [Burkholderiales bacterium]